MEISPYLLLLLFVYSFAFGGALGLLYDGFCIVRSLFSQDAIPKRIQKLYERPLPLLHRPIRVPHKVSKVLHGIVSFLLDILFFLVAAWGLLVLHYYLNKGSIRLFTLPVTALGFLLYRATVGRLLRSVSALVVYGLRAVLAMGAYLIYLPLGWMTKLLQKLCDKILKKVRKAIAKRTVARYNIRKRKELCALAAQGFLQLQDVEKETGNGTQGVLY